MRKNFDFVVVGGGIVGLTAALELVRRRLGSVLVLEKESRLGEHSSGRNSGVLHSGIYYAADTMKARICAEGSRRMRAYAAEKGILCTVTGKVIVAPSARLAGQIDNLMERARQNGVRAEKIDAARLKRIEPEAVTFENAIFVPDTAVIDSRAVLSALKEDLSAAGAEVRVSAEALDLGGNKNLLKAGKEEIGFGHLINAAGLHADKVARRFGAGKRYRILPFKGVYRKLRPAAAAKFRGSIYPVPDLNMPFLGVHITRNVHGEVYAGPTAIPAFGRENYGFFKGLDLKELPAMAGNLGAMVLRDENGFRSMVAGEIAKYATAGFLRSVRELAPALQKEHLGPVSKVGLRAQLVDVEKKRLEMDFILERSYNSTHVLNAISPAFTSSFALAEKIVDFAVRPS